LNGLVISRLKVELVKSGEFIKFTFQLRVLEGNPTSQQGAGLTHLH